MTAALTRRGLVQAGTVAIGATVAGLPALAKATAVNADAALLDLIARHAEVVAERGTHEARLEAARERFSAAVPPRPAALNDSLSDLINRLVGTGREMRPDGKMQSFFMPGDIDRMRAAGPVTELVWDNDGLPLPSAPNPRGEARRIEILAAHDAWEGEKQALRDRVGLTAAEAEDDRFYEAMWLLRDAIRETKPATLAALCAKARWAIAIADGQEENEQVVCELAAFDGVAL